MRIGPHDEFNCKSEGRCFGWKTDRSDDEKYRKKDDCESAGIARSAVEAKTRAVFPNLSKLGPDEQKRLFDLVEFKPLDLAYVLSRCGENAE